MKQLATLVLLFVTTLIYAQLPNTQFEDPVTWKFSVEKTSDSEYDLIFKADIEEEWHVYSQHNPEGGAWPLEIIYDDLGTDFELVGASEEGKTYTAYNDIFGVDEIFFKEKLYIKQHIKVLNPELKAIQGSLSGQACIDVCIQLDKDFVFSLTGEKAEVASANVSNRDVEMSNALTLDMTDTEYLATDQKGKSFWGIFFLGFIGGLIALLTPCVFPMIPLTVSFFTKQSKDRKRGITNAVLYGIFIIVIYVLLSIPFHVFDTIDAESLNNISTNVVLNTVFFIIIITFAFSFFGYFEITLPTSWGNKMDNASNVGGIIGIFFMSLTLAIVSFSCTGPILGSLLVGSLSADGGAMQLTVGMAAFGVALALPFALFALFPSWLNSLPKSGGWMTTTKVFLGFLELALALKFISNADLVMHWGILKREIFIAIWIIIFVLLTAYMFGLFRFPHDGPKGKISKGRAFIGLLSGAFSLYLILGIFGVNNLKLLSGFPPPTSYSILKSTDNKNAELTIFHDLDEGFEYAAANNKIVMLDFTGWACVNCRKVEEQIWTTKEVHQILTNDVVIISLYVDDRAKLPEAEQFNYLRPNGGVKEIETIGDKWATFQAINFQSASQPFYVLMTADKRVLSKPIQYVPQEEYLDWLKTSLSRK